VVSSVETMVTRAGRQRGHDLARPECERIDKDELDTTTSANGLVVAITAGRGCHVNLATNTAS